MEDLKSVNLELTSEDIKFAKDLIENSPEPNDKLKAAAARHKQFLKKQNEKS